jgi:hypothetical protein
MPRICTVCNHKDKENIDILIIKGEPYRSIAKQFSLSDAAVYRHKSHLNGTLIKAKGVKEMAQANNLMEQISSLQSRALNILSKTEEAEDWRAATGAIREVRSILELLGKIAGELNEGQTVNITVSPEWIEVRAVILETLAPFPEARISLSKALERIANGKIST